MKFRRFLAASLAGGLMILAGCDDGLLGLESDWFSYSTDDSYDWWPDDSWGSGSGSDDGYSSGGGFWPDFMDLKSG